MAAGGADGGPDPASRETFLERGRAMIPALRARAQRAERDRRMPDETHRAFADAGFYRLFQPARYGGYEMDWRLLVDMNVELGRGFRIAAETLGSGARRVACDVYDLEPEAARSPARSSA